MYSLAHITAGHMRYYSESEEVAGGGRWFGSGAKILGLDGVASSRDLLRAMSGPGVFGRGRGSRKPKDDQFVAGGSDVLTADEKRRLAESREGRIAGYDATFSAPKSVSLLAAAYPNEEVRDAIQEAHSEAVTIALNYLESVSLYARQKEDSENFSTPAHLVSAVFTHPSSRPQKEGEGLLDGPQPDLHSHCLIFNLAIPKGNEDATYALAERMLYEHSPEVGAVYRMALSQRLEAMGFKTKEKGWSFEVEGFPEEMIKYFSPRTENAHSVTGLVPFEDHTKVENKQLSRQVVTTRGGKSDDEETVNARTQDILDHFTMEDGSRFLIGNVRTNFIEEQLDNIRNLDLHTLGTEELEKEGTKLVVQALNGNRSETVINRLAEVTIRLAGGSATYATEAHIGEKLASLCRRLPVYLGNDYRTSFTDIYNLKSLICNSTAAVPIVATKTAMMDQPHQYLFGGDEKRRVVRRKYMLAREPGDLEKLDNTIGDLSLNRWNLLDRQAPNDLIERLAVKYSLNAEQRNCLSGLLTNSRIDVVEGGPGTGKTTLIAALAEGATELGIKIYGTSFTALAASQIVRASNVESRTVDSLLMRLPKDPEKYRDSILVVDETSMLDIGRFETVLGKANDLNLKIIVIGDRLQVPAIERTGSFIRLSKNIGRWMLLENRRQRNEIDRLVVERFRSGSVGQALNLLGQKGSISVHGGRASYMTSIVSEYVDAVIANVDLVGIAPTNREVNALNKSIEESLFAKGLLGERHVLTGTRRFGIGERRALVVHQGSKIMFTLNNKDVHGNDIQNGMTGWLAPIIRSTFYATVAPIKLPLPTSWHGWS